MRAETIRPRAPEILRARLGSFGASALPCDPLQAPAFASALTLAHASQCYPRGALMADAASGAGVASGAGHDGERPAATEHGVADATTPLAELVSDEVGAPDTWDLKVFRSEINEYTYTWQGKQHKSRRVVAILLSQVPEQY